MQKVIGIGGVFFKAKDPQGLAEWYARHLGVPVIEGQPYAVFASKGADEHTVWATFPSDSNYFGTGFMVNFRVADLDTMLAQLRAGGVEVVPDVQEDENGRFGWAVDPEGNRIELWEPQPPAGTPT